MTDYSDQSGYEQLKLIKAKKMLLTLGIFAIIMMFAGLTSGYIVSKFGAEYWVNITIPTEFWTSMILLLISSVFIALAYHFSKRNKQSLALIFTVITFALGLSFSYTQWQGYVVLQQRGIPFTGNFLKHLNGVYGEDYYITKQNGERIIYEDQNYYDPEDLYREHALNSELENIKNSAGSYFSFLVFLHVLHVFGGMLFLLFLIIKLAFGRITSTNNLVLRQGAVYWHFVDGLWIYLLLFLYFIH